MHHGLALHVGQSKAQYMGRGGGGLINHDAGGAFGEQGDNLRPGGSRRFGRTWQSAGGGETGGSRHIFGARAEAELLAAAEHNRRNALAGEQPFGNVQSADALGTVQLVGADRHKVGVQAVGLIAGGVGELQKTLDRVGMGDDFGIYAPGKGESPRRVVGGSRLVVHAHDA